MGVMVLVLLAVLQVVAGLWVVRCAQRPVSLATVQAQHRHGNAVASTTLTVCGCVGVACFVVVLL